MTAQVGLRWSANADLARVGEVTGRAELCVRATDSESAIALVDAVLQPGPGGGRCAEPGTARSLAVADRDRVLVQVHLDLYGALIETTLTCERCADRYDLAFRLDELAAHCEPDPAERTQPQPWRLGDLEFRPLTGEDELAVLAGLDGDAATALFRRVTAADDVDADVARPDVADALARLSPPVAAPIGASCPECGADQSVDFDVQGYLLARILRERPRLWRSVHLIAGAYHWSRAEILSLTRTERSTYVDALTTSTRRSRAR